MGLFSIIASEVCRGALDLKAFKVADSNPVNISNFVINVLYFFLTIKTDATYPKRFSVKDTLITLEYLQIEKSDDRGTIIAIVNR